MNKYPDWDQVENSFTFAEERYGSNISEIINHDFPFDEFRLMENYILENCAKWNKEEF